MTSPRWSRLIRRGRDTGSAGSPAVEVLIVAPVIILIALLCIAGGRYVLGSGKIDQAAGAAARAASLAATADAASSAAHAEAEAALVNAGITCENLTVQVDSAAFALPPGTPGSVTVTLSCTTSLGDLSIPGLPGSRTVTATAASPIDTHQEGRT